MFNYYHLNYRKREVILVMSGKETFLMKIQTILNFYWQEKCGRRSTWNLMQIKNLKCFRTHFLVCLTIAFPVKLKIKS